MDANEALEKFLRRCLLRRVDRYVEFASSPKNRTKLLAAIHHDLETDVDRSLACESLSEAALDAPAYRFAPRSDFGTKISSLREVVESHEMSLLAIARDGSAAVLRPEARVDSQLLFELSGH